MVFLEGLLLTGVGASAAQNAPVNTICSQCGAVLASGVHVCAFCNSSASLGTGKATASTHGNLALDSAAEQQWRGELNQRLLAYRARRRKLASNRSQAQFSFAEGTGAHSDGMAVQVDNPRVANPSGSEDFAFSIAIGRSPKKLEPAETRLLIDVSVPPRPEDTATNSSPEPINPDRSGLFPIASLDERRRAVLIDAACLAFAYGGFLVLFGSLGGQFTFSKLSAAVCFSTFAFVYLQYFGLFTIFGGTTPGMMVRGLQVASFSGDVPTPRQFLVRAAGYLLSAGTVFLGFLWALWDEDALTWHDRLSHTYLTAPDVLLEGDVSHPATAH
jgi:uncharacterized RDD family membrane protein YckC